MPATDNFRWNQRTLHVVFAASSLILLVSVIAMMRQDQADEWRAYQRTNFNLEASLRERDLKEVRSKEYVAELTALETQKQGADAKDAEFRQKQGDLLKTADQQLREVERLEVELKFKNSIRDQARGVYDLASRDAVSGPALEKLYADFQTRQGECNEWQAKLDGQRQRWKKRT